MTWYDEVSAAFPRIAPSELQSRHEHLDRTMNSRLTETLRLSAEEAGAMRVYYHCKVRDICAALDFSLLIAHDAHWFLHRYFLQCGLLEQDTKHVMLAAIFLATKTQNVRMTMKEFITAVPNSQADAIASSEQVLLGLIEYNFPSFNPVPCVFGWILDYITIQEIVAEDYIHELKLQSLDLLQRALIIDRILLAQSASHIALACVLLAAETLQSESSSLNTAVAAFWESRLQKLENFSGLYETVSAIQSDLKAFLEPAPDYLRPIDRKLRQARPQ